MKYCLYIQPYTYIKINNDKLLFYSCLSNQLYVETDIEVCSFLYNSSLEKEYICDLSEQEAANESIKIFTSKIRKYFMGDIIKQTNSETPIVFVPKPKIQSENLTQDNKSKLWDGENILNNVFTLNIYTNGVEYADYFANAHKQFLFPIQSEQELILEKLQGVFKTNNFHNLRDINIVGSQQYSTFEKLVRFLQTKDIAKTYVFLSDNLETDRLISIDDKTIYEIIFAVTSAIEKDIIKILEKLKGGNFVFRFVVSTEEELQKINFLIEKYNIDDYEINPYFTGRNFDFFKNNVFVNQSDLEMVQLTMQDIMAKSKLNPLTFGKLSIMPNGDVFSNLNCPKIGNLYNESIKSIIMNEFDKSYSWTYSRNKKQECEKCVFNLLCPPITNYEYCNGISKICNF